MLASGKNCRVYVTCLEEHSWHFDIFHLVTSTFTLFQTRSHSKVHSKGLRCRYIFPRDHHSIHQNYVFIYFYKSPPSFFHNFIHLLAMLGLCCCPGFPLVAASRRLLSSCGAWASHCGGFSYCRAQSLGHSGFSSCHTWAQ